MVVSKEKRGLALVEFANVQAAVSILTLPVLSAHLPVSLRLLAVVGYY